MKTPKSLCVSILAASLLIAFCAEAFAVTGWYTATVEEAGPCTSGSYAMKFRLSIGSTTKWYKAPTGREKEMLAVALTAISINKQVRVYTDPDLANPVVSNMTLKK